MLCLLFVFRAKMRIVSISIFFVILFSFDCTLCQNTPSEDSPRIIIIGAGPSGIAAAAKLLEKGYKNVKILEAEDRIGGRVYSVPMGEYLVDMGGQWVVGETDNFVYEVAWPLGLLEHFNNTGFIRLHARLFKSSGEEFAATDSTFDEILEYGLNLTDNIPEDLSDLKTGSLGEYIETKLNDYFKAHPGIPADQHKPLINFLQLLALSEYSADNWYKVGARGIRESEDCEGDPVINWKNRTYGTILDILMKKYPNPEEELPVMSKTMLNDKVTKINYDTPDGIAKIDTENGKSYLADYVIFTCSLGVLKADYAKLFEPPLPENKTKAIEAVGMGTVAKIYLYYENPWWTDDSYLRGFLWSDEERKEMEKDPEKRWMLSVYGFIPVEYKPKLICVWLSGPYVADMELIPEDVLREKIVELTKKFFGHSYNITEPSMMKRTQWTINENFRGTYSYRSVDGDKEFIGSPDLAEPIMKNSKPILQFAGEATAYYYGTIHGAIDSGRREADRLMKHYSST